MHANPASVEPSAAASSEKYLTFQVGSEHYGIKVLCTREIIRQTAITSVPQMPPHVRGVINLRGRIIPVIDLRIRFGLPTADAQERACIIVVQVAGGRSAVTATGLIVDAVDEVVLLAAEDIEAAPEIMSGGGGSHIVGMAKVKGGLKTLLDLDVLLAA